LLFRQLSVWVVVRQLPSAAFGTSLVVTPTVMDRDLIRLQVVPEFSEINSNNTVNGIPGTNVKRVQTTVELREGQTFAIGGLLSRQELTNISRIPLLGDIPYIGPRLFQSKTLRKWKRNCWYWYLRKLCVRWNQMKFRLCQVSTIHIQTMTICGILDGLKAHLTTMSIRSAPSVVAIFMECLSDTVNSIRLWARELDLIPVVDCRCRADHRSAAELQIRGTYATAA
jgi:hypothetical protein